VSHSVCYDKVFGGFQQGAVIFPLDKAEQERQYADSRKLRARARLFDYAVEDVPWWRWVADHAVFGRGERVLEVGCGPGWFWAAVADAVPFDLALTLTDLSPGMVEDAALKVGALGRYRIDTAVADVVHLPFADESFDAVLAMHMFYHVTDPARGMAEIARVLKPGRRAVVTTNGRNDLRAYYALGAAAFGGSATNPAAAVFGFEEAEALMGAEFGNVAMARHPARLRITEPGHVFDSLTSYPPGEDASEAEQSALRTAIADTFAQGGGVLEVAKETAVFVSRKAC
jgi:SAM-dependent methyltransferase